jgi:hypothetical protein
MVDKRHRVRQQQRQRRRTRGKGTGNGGKWQGLRGDGDSGSSDLALPCAMLRCDCVTLCQLLADMNRRREQDDEELDAQRAQAMIRANQQPLGDVAAGDKKVDKWCGKRKLLVLQLGRADGKTGRIDQELHGFGLGAAMHVLSVALSYGIRHNRTLVLPDKDSWWYTDPSLCKSRSFSCFFEPVSPCSTGRHVGSEAMQDLTEESERPRRGARARVLVAPTRLDKFLNHEDNRCVTHSFEWSRALGLLVPRSFYFTEPTLPRQAMGAA